MSKILIVGNVTKDVYLALDERYNNFERDEQSPWLDLHFNGSRYPFFHRSTFYGGAAVSLGVLHDFRLAATISGNDLYFDQGGLSTTQKPIDYRYILSQDEHSAYLCPVTMHPTNWVKPAARPDWIFIDCSAQLTVGIAKQIKAYLDHNTSVHLAFFIPQGLDEASRLLLPRADIVFTANTATLPINYHKQVCLITKDAIQMDHYMQTWSNRKAELLTPLTAYAIIATTVLAALIKERTIEQALALASLNIEHSSLDRSLPEERLLPLLESKIL